MRRKRINGLDKSIDCMRIVDTCVETVDGLERAHINLATGEITYGSDACINEELLHETFGKHGLKLEDMEEGCAKK